MGQTPDTLKPDNPAVAKHRIEELRAEMSTALDELARRRHELLDWRLQLRQHRRLVNIVAGSLVFTVVLVGVVMYRKREARLSRVERLTLAVRQAWYGPEKKSRTKDVAAAGLRGAASSAGKRLGERLIVT
jgi:hypothetical protein